MKFTKLCFNNAHVGNICVAPTTNIYDGNNKDLIPRSNLRLYSWLHWEPMSV